MKCENCENRLKERASFLSAEEDMGYYIRIIIYQCPMCGRVHIKKESTRP